MIHSKKYRVVPYVNDIEKPTESYLENLDKNMSNIISDEKVPDDQKLKLYSKNLNNFLLKYDPDSFGTAPAITKLAKVVTKYLENNGNTQKIEKDLDSLFSQSSLIKGDIFDLFEDSSRKKPSNSDASNHFNSSLNSSYKENFNNNNNPINPLDSNIDNFTSANEYNDTNDTFIDKSKQNNSFNYSSASKIKNNTRSKADATHYTDLNNKLITPKRLPNSSEKKDPKFNSNSKQKTNKFKKKTKKQEGSGFQNGGSGLWYTKKFF